MNPAPLGLIPFIPSGENFQLSKAFFERLGFAVNWEAEGLAELQWGEAVFVLQDFHHQEMQENLMFTLIVPDLEAFWASWSASGIAGDFPEVKSKEPTRFPWGDREVHIIDPAGVCWHVREGG